MMLWEKKYHQSLKKKTINVALMLHSTTC